MKLNRRKKTETNQNETNRNKTTQLKYDFFFCKIAVAQRQRWSFPHPDFVDPIVVHLEYTSAYRK